MTAKRGSKDYSGHRSGLRAALQASQLIERWQPWWYSPDAGRLQLTSRGTWPVKPLAEADTPADELGQQGGEQDGGGSAAASPVPEPPFEPVRVCLFNMSQQPIHLPLSRA